MKQLARQRDDSDEAQDSGSRGLSALYDWPEPDHREYLHEIKREFSVFIKIKFEDGQNYIDI